MVGAGGAEEFAVGAADAEGEDADAFLLGALGGLDGVVFLVFAVGDEDDDFVVVAFFFEGFQARVDGVAEGGAALRDDADVEGVDALAEGVVIEGERALQKGGAGEGDEAEAVGAGELHEVEGGEFGALEAVGFEVFGEHAARGVDGDEDVEAALAGLFPAEAPLRPGEREDEKDHGDDEEAEAEFLAGGETPTRSCSTRREWMKRAMSACLRRQDQTKKSTSAGKRSARSQRVRGWAKVTLAGVQGLRFKVQSSKFGV